jgi:hypothetical protein
MNRIFSPARMAGEKIHPLRGRIFFVSHRDTVFIAQGSITV